MNEENEWDHKISAEVKEGPADCIRMDELRAALKKMKRYKAPGLSGLVTEMIQATGDTGTQSILDLCNGFVKEGSIPDDWKCSVVLLVSKIEFKWHQMVYCSSKTLDYTEPKNVPGGTDVPNFIKIGQTVAEIWRFNVFFQAEDGIRDHA